MDLYIPFFIQLILLATSAPVRFVCAIPTMLIFQTLRPIIAMMLPMYALSIVTQCPFPLNMCNMWSNRFTHFLHPWGVVVTVTQTAIRLSTKHAYVQLVQREHAVRDGQWVDCHASPNELGFQTLRDGTVVPSCNAALVEGDPTSKFYALLPPFVEAIFQCGKFTGMMSCVMRTAHTFALIDLVPLAGIVISIVIKVKTTIHIIKCASRHTFHACANYIQGFPCRPCPLNWRIALQTPSELASKKPNDVFRLIYFSLPVQKYFGFQCVILMTWSM